MCRWWIYTSESSDDVRPLKKEMKKQSSSILKILDFIFKIWVYERRTIKRDLVQGLWFETSAQENLDKQLWATKTTQKCKTRVFPLPNPDTPDPIARSVWVTIPGLKIRFARSLQAYTRSFRVTLRPTAIFWAEGYKYPLTPFSPLSLATLTSWTQT